MEFELGGHRTVEVERILPPHRHFGRNDDQPLLILLILDRQIHQGAEPGHIKRLYAHAGPLVVAAGRS